MQKLVDFLVMATALTVAPVLVSAQQVQTDKGALQGKAIAAGRVEAFLGVPYAAPPVGELRWRPPVAAAAWTGVRDATQYGAHCMQGAVFADMVFPTGVSEDCLTLNVYRPKGATAGSKLPVMFWIHGGGYAGGASSEPRHDGEFLAQKGVILVTINYRLGAFGFFAVPELVAEGHGAAGNYGLMDMIAALEWVQRNIGGFGGDAGNVTIFGESAGSYAVSTLMAAPRARGLFAHAIGESGGAFPPPARVETAEVSAEHGAERAEKLLGTSSLAALRAMPAEKLLAKGLAEPMTVVVDGRVLAEPVEETFAAGREAHVPLLAGWNHDEGGIPADMTVAKWHEFAAKSFGPDAEEFLRLYPGATDAEATRSAADYAADKFIVLTTWKWIEAARQTSGAPVYRYELDLVPPVSKFHPGAFVFHSDDIEYVFGALDSRPGAVWRAQDRALSEQMMTYWTNFAKTGDPNGAGLPKWPQFQSDGRPVMHLDAVSEAGPDVTGARHAFLVRVGVR